MIGYPVLYGIIWILTLLPFKVLYIISDFLSFITYYLIPYRKKVTLTNLKKSFPEKSSTEIKKIAKKFYRHLFDLFLESFKLLQLDEQEILKHYSYQNPEVLDDLYLKNKSIIAVFGHYGNWEWLASLPLVTKYNVLAVYKPLLNKSIDKLCIRLREKFGVVTITMQQTLRKIIEYQQNHKLTITFFLGDQRPLRRDIRYWTTFLNQDTPVLLGVERISKKTNQAVIYIDIQKKKRGHYEIVFTKLFENPNETGDYEITEAHTRILWKNIINRPELWLWSHRRWKHEKLIEK
ncbi:MAG: lysophospholipid acyltransferase family protein [Bacteroidales bacterium]|nr:lysophospholipid acyltransferase family protein [Bacteroidales bacterium]